VTSSALIRDDDVIQEVSLCSYEFDLKCARKI